MIFEATPVHGAFVIRAEHLADERGFFARTWCRDVFALHVGPVVMEQSSVSFNRRAGTLRGLHFAWPPAAEHKLVRCSRGRMFDVVVDLRPASPTFTQHFSVMLDAARSDSMFIPSGCAHGFQTLVDDCEVTYMMTEAYRPELQAGIAFDDPSLDIDWPLPVSVISERDRSAPRLDRTAHAARFGRST